MDIIAYEMKCFKEAEKSGISCIPFSERYFDDYMRIYNECFYDMRRALDVRPYAFLSKYDQIRDKSEDIFLLIEGEDIVGSVACYSGEIDDLIVNEKYRRRGYGKKLLLWAMEHIIERGGKEITLHVAEWNEGTIELYKKVGFEITKTERINTAPDRRPPEDHGGKNEKPASETKQ